MKLITLLDPAKKFVENKTLIVFDEIKEFPDIATSLKSFCQDARYDVICSGWLLGIHYKRIQSNSVGYKMDYEMQSWILKNFCGRRITQRKDIRKYAERQIIYTFPYFCAFLLKRYLKEQEEF